MGDYETQGNKDIHYAVLQNSESICTILLNKNADNISARNKSAATPLHLACRKGFAGLVNMLVRRGANLRLVDQDGNTPLHQGARSGNVQICKILLHKDKDLVNIKNNEGRTPLFYAAEKGNKMSAETLLDYGADRDVTDSPGKTPLIVAIENDKSEVAMTLQLYVAKEPLPLVEENPAVEPRGAGPMQMAAMTPLNNKLHNAAKRGAAFVIIKAIDDGAEIDSKDPGDGKTPLHHASEAGHDSAVRKLLDKGADRTLLDLEDNTPLHLACINNRFEAIKLLVTKNRELITQKNKKGSTPLTIAEGNDDQNIYEFLLTRNEM